MTSEKSSEEVDRMENTFYTKIVENLIINSTSDKSSKMEL
jgi:hypothetical protein